MDAVVAGLFGVNRLVRAAETEDEVGTVLRIHLAMDQILNHFIRQCINNDLKPYIEKPRYTGQRITLSAAFGLPLPFIGAAYEINKIRNDIAHEDLEFTSGAIRQFTLKVDRLVNVDRQFTPLAGRYIELPATHPGRKFIFGKNGARLDFLIASFAFLDVLARWMIAHGYTQTV